MTWSPMEPIRQAVGYILLADELDGMLCRFRQLEEPLNVLCGGAGSEEFSKVTQNLLMRAFRRNDLSSEYACGFDDIRVKGGEGHYLLCRVATQYGTRGKAHELVRLRRRTGGDPIPISGDGVPQYNHHGNIDNHPINSLSF